MTDPFASQLASIKRADDDRDPAFLSMAVALAEELRAGTDTDFIRLGALAEIATTPRAGHERTTLVEFANNIGAGRAALSQYRSVVTFFDGYTQTHKLLEEMPNIGFSHLRSAMRLKDYEDARDILQKWSADGTTTGAAHIEVNEIIGKPVKPQPLWDGGAVIESLELRPGEATLTVKLAVGDFDPQLLKDALTKSWDETGGGLKTHLVMRKE